MQYGKKMNRYERREFQTVKLAHDLHGEGIYVFENRSSEADLHLPKPTLGGKRLIGPKEQFQGDNYFMALVARNELRLIRTIQTPQQQEVILSENRLILDQPDTVTSSGKVEHVETKAAKNGTKLENAKTKHSSDVLLTEDPMSGVEILND